MLKLEFTPNQDWLSVGYERAVASFMGSERMLGQKKTGGSSPPVGVLGPTTIKILTAEGL